MFVQAHIILTEKDEAVFRSLKTSAEKTAFLAAKFVARFSQATQEAMTDKAVLEKLEAEDRARVDSVVSAVVATPVDGGASEVTRG